MRTTARFKAWTLIVDRIAKSVEGHGLLHPRRTIIILACLFALLASHLRGEEIHLIESFFPEEEKTQIVAEAGLGYRSNVFETNPSIEATVGDWFWNVQAALVHPLATVPNLSLTFQGGWLEYFRLSQITEYSFLPGVAWQVFDGNDSKLVVSLEGGAFRKRIYLEFQKTPNVSIPGLGGSAGWKWERAWSENNSIVWSGGFSYQHFNSDPQNLYTALTSAKWVHEFGEGNSLEIGSDWEGQSYSARPSGHNNQLNNGMSAAPPKPLTIIEGRGFVRYSFPIGAGFSAESSLNMGGNIDTTSGHYNAFVFGGEGSLNWRSGKWHLKLGAEPEFAWFPNRPASLGTINPKLRTQEYVLEGLAEYRCNERLAIGVSSVNHLQITNSPINSSATLQSFFDRILSLKVSLSY